MEKLILINDAPEVGESGWPLDGVVGYTIAKTVSLTYGELQELTDMRQLIKDPIGRRMPLPPAARHAAQAGSRKLRDRRVLMVGQAVALAFGIRRPDKRFPVLLWGRVNLYGHSAMVGVMPHPIRDPYWWTDFDRHRALRRFLEVEFPEQAEVPSLFGTGGA